VADHLPIEMSSKPNLESLHSIVIMDAMSRIKVLQQFSVISNIYFNYDANEISSILSKKVGIAYKSIEQS